MRELELLAPARNAEAALQAILHGADAVYMGASSHGARHEAANDINSIKRVAEFAHKYYARLYVTLNTLVYEEELPKVERLIKELYSAQVDALIIQDLGILKLDIPPIALHASTQCDIRTPQRARLMQALGFSQIVLARELSLGAIREITGSVDIPVEAFVHGALCVSYSGCCNAGFLLAGRSGNRGECPQICRLPYSLVDGNGKVLASGKHLLSLKDMNRVDHLEEMARAGVSSFKIEGRLKNVDYVKNTVAAYRAALDRIIDASSGEFRRSSQGYERLAFTPDLTKSFNRGYTDYFLKSDGRKIACFDTPKMVGEKVGEVKEDHGGYIVVAISPGTTLSNGDGLGVFTADGKLEGFRLNRVEGNRIYLHNRPAERLRPGTAVYRNSDKAWISRLAADTAQRKMSLDFILDSNTSNKTISLTAQDSYGHRATVARRVDSLDPAVSEQVTHRKKLLAKLGATMWELDRYTDNAGDVFIPASVTAELKRDAVETLESCRNATRPIEYRKEASLDKAAEIMESLPPEHNIANSKGVQLIGELGQGDNYQKAVEIEPTQKSGAKAATLMETRYCLRRELGACLKEGRTVKIPATDLYLLTPRGQKLKLEFDCNNCKMKITQNGVGRS